MKIAGNFKAGALLGRIVYYYLPSKNGKPHKLRVKKDGVFWIAKKRQDWQEETFLATKEFDGALGMLVDNGLVEKKTFHFSGKPTLHVRLILDKFLESLTHVIMDSAKENESYFAEMGITILPKGENAQLHSDLGSIYNNTYIEQKNVTSVDEDDSDVTLDAVCPECGSNTIVTEKYDPKQRCSYCLLRAAWEYFFPEKSQPRLGTMKYRVHVSKRWEKEHFRDHYQAALARASKSRTCKEQSWFDFEFFIKNDTNYAKMLPVGFWMQWKDDQLPPMGAPIGTGQL